MEEEGDSELRSAHTGKPSTSHLAHGAGHLERILLESVDLSHHLAGLVKLLQKTVDLLDVGARAAGYALAAGSIDQLGIGTLAGVME